MCLQLGHGKKRLQMQVVAGICSAKKRLQMQVVAGICSAFKMDVTRYDNDLKMECICYH